MERVDIATDQIGFSDGDEGGPARPLRSAQVVAVHQDRIGGRGHRSDPVGTAEAAICAGDAQRRILLGSGRKRQRSTG